MQTPLPFTPMPMRQMIIFIGIQASGKSTFYRQCLKPLGYAHINLDILRTRHREATMMQECLQSGRPLAIDNTNPSTADRQRYINAAREHGYQIIGIFFQSVLRDCLVRNAQRQAKVPEVALAATQNKLQLPQIAEGFDALYFAKITEQGIALSEWH